MTGPNTTQVFFGDIRKVGRRHVLLPEELLVDCSVELVGTQKILRLGHLYTVTVQVGSFSLIFLRVFILYDIDSNTKL